VYPIAAGEATGATPAQMAAGEHESGVEDER
jgi:hypothetical protein